MKRCSGCGEEKPDSEYYAGRSACKACVIAQVQANRLAKDDYYKAKARNLGNRGDRARAQARYKSTLQGRAAVKRANNRN